MTRDHPHRAILAEWLPRVNQDPRRLEHYELLTGGVSGSYAYRLRGPDGPCVLKVTQAVSPPYARQRALREITFYRALAGSVPVRVPRLLASAIDPGSGASALLLAAYSAPLAPQVWQLADYLELARQLAQPHAAYWNADEQLAAWEWLRPPPTLSPVDVQAASRLWQTIWDQPQNADLFLARRRKRLERLLQHIAADPQPDTGLPLTLCHNDCHMDNLLRDEAGGWFWADWQEVGPGYGPEDLSFFFQRASASGAAPPLDATVTAYCKQLSALTGQPLSVDTMRRHMAAYELRTRLVQWPAYLVAAAPEQLGALVERIEQLAGEK